MYKLTNGNSIIRTADGASIPMAEGNRDYVDYQDWVAAGNVPDPADPVPVEPSRWSTLEFLERFTKQERNTIRAAAKQSPDLEDWLDLLRAAGEVVATDQRTIDGLAALVAAGLITQARADMILDV